MSSRATSLEPKSQFTINLDPGWECQSLPLEEKKRENSQSKSGRKEIPNQKSGRKQNEKIPNRRVGERKKEKKIPIKDRKKTREIYRMVFGPDNIWTNTELSPSKQKKKGNHDLKWPSPFDYQPKSCVSASFSPRTKQKQKRKRPKTFKAKIPTKNTIPKKKSYWSMITHVIFDLIGNALQDQVMAYLWFGIRTKHLPVWD